MKKEIVIFFVIITQNWLINCEKFIIAIVAENELSFI